MTTGPDFDAPGYTVRQVETDTVEPVEPVTPADRRVNDPQHEDADPGDQEKR